jgi:hypothetical protein
MKVEKYVAKNSQACKELENAVELLLKNCNIVGEGADNLSCELIADTVEVKPCRNEISAVAICSNIENNPARMGIAQPTGVLIDIEKNKYRIIYSSK